MTSGLPKKILGISAYYHDSAAVLTVGDDIVAAAHEERFSRKKHDDSFPRRAVAYVLSEADLELHDLDAIVFYDKPFIKFERLLETYHAFAPRGVSSFATAMPVWIKEKVFMKTMLRNELMAISPAGADFPLPPLLFTEHHLSHAASAFYPSPFKEAAILTVDGVGEWATTTIGKGNGKDISILKEMRFPHSVGLLYSAFTYYCGFKVNSGEYKLMGLAPYGRGGAHTEEIRRKILSEIVSVKDDGSVLLNMDYFSFATGLKMCDDRRWQELFGFPPRSSEGEITESYMDMALAIQEITEMVMIKMARYAKELTGAKNLVMAGGVALNCVANEKILNEKIFDDIWIQPASGDAGGALGAALAGLYVFFGAPRMLVNNSRQDAMQGSYLGPDVSDKDALRVAKKYDAPFKKYDDEEKLFDDTAQLIANGKVVGWVDGRMEWGPRALGNRSILGDARNPEMQKKMNLKIKFREGFRPFAPSVLEEDIGEHFETDRSSPYMLFTAPIKKNRRKPLVSVNKSLYERLYSPRSDLPAITHLDYSARLQSVSRQTNPRYWKLINAFKGKTGYGVVVNTSFNVRGEPIVCTAEDAYRCFMRTEMDYLVIGNILFDKTLQPSLAKKIIPTYELKD